MDKFEKIIRDIKSLKIQGADNVAIEGAKAYCLRPNKKTEQLLKRLRPTEPALFNSLKYIKKHSLEDILNYFKNSREEISNYAQKLIKNNSIIFTHCHSSAVMSILKKAKKKGKKLKVINTETRPLYQGRKTAKELAKVGINVTTIPDSAAGDALKRGGLIKKSNMVLLGADAILKNKVINKIGSGMFAEIAYDNKIPVYIACNSWKYSKNLIKIEERDYHEIWKKAPKSIKIKNPAFESIDFKYIKAIISELGILSPKQFIKKIK